MAKVNVSFTEKTETIVIKKKVVDKVNLELTVEEALHIQVILGKIGGPSTIRDRLYVVLKSNLGNNYCISEGVCDSLNWLVRSHFDKYITENAKLIEEKLEKLNGQG